MHVARLELLDYRSYEHAVVDLGPGVTVLVGSNGQGKTNLVEALGYLATLGSHRVAGDAPLVRDGCSRAIVRAAIVGDGRTVTAELEIAASGANRARLNGAPTSRPRDLVGLLRTVLFAPEDLALVKGDPADRRRFLDDLLVQRTPRMAAVRADVDKVLRQRNALLKTMRSGRRDENAESTLAVWDEQLALHGARLIVARRALVDDLRPHLVTAYDRLAPGSGPAALEYRCTIDAGDPAEPSAELGADGAADIETDAQDADAVATRFRAALLASRRADVERGLTLVGPHRDELMLGLRGLPAKGYASHGEAWSVALGLRLASYVLLVADGGPGGDPVLVLDDVFAELDVQRRERLAAEVADAEQVLVTAAVAADVPAALGGRRLRVARDPATSISTVAIEDAA